jgi:hypothetical protein
MTCTLKYFHTLPSTFDWAYSWSAYCALLFCVSSARLPYLKWNQFYLWSTTVCLKRSFARAGPSSATTHNYAALSFRLCGSCWLPACWRDSNYFAASLHATGFTTGSQCLQASKQASLQFWCFQVRDWTSGSASLTVLWMNIQSARWSGYRAWPVCAKRPKLALNAVWRVIVCDSGIWFDRLSYQFWLCTLAPFSTFTQ